MIGHFLWNCFCLISIHNILLPDSINQRWVRTIATFTPRLKDSLIIVHFALYRRLIKQVTVTIRAKILVFIDKFHIIEEHSATSNLFMNIVIALIYRHLAFFQLLPNSRQALILCFLLRIILVKNCSTPPYVVRTLTK